MLHRLDTFKPLNINQPKINTGTKLNASFISNNKTDAFQNISFLGASTPLDKTPVNSLLAKFKPCTIDECEKTFAGDTAFLNAAKEIKELGYSKLTFPELRATLIKEDGSYNMKKLATLISLSTNNNGKNEPVKTVREQHKDPNWLYNSSIVEYVNIRALGVNNPDGSVKRLGNVLDGIVYALQSRSGGFHVAPFHESSFMDQVYVPKDTYSVDHNILSNQLTKNGFNYRNQIKLFADVCHAKNEPIALFYDTLPHTGDISVNYLDMPEAAKWIDLDEKVISKNSKTFNQLKPYFENVSINSYEEFNNILKNQIAKVLPVNIDGIYEDLNKSLDQIHNANNLNDNFQNECSIELKYAIKNANNGVSSTEIFKNPKSYIQGKEKAIETELFTLTVRKAVVLSTHLAETDADIEILRKNSEKVWATSNETGIIPSAEASELILSKDSIQIAKKIKSIVKGQIGKLKPTYEDIQKSEENWDSSIKKRMMNKDRIFNMPVGAWNGLVPELVGFHKEYNYPIFSCRGNSQTNFRYNQSNEFKDVAWKMFGTLARRNLNLNNGEENKAAIKEWKDTVEFWMETGFDGLRLDQTDHLYTKPYDYDSNSNKTLEEYFRDQDYAYDTILPQNMKSLLDGLRKDLGNSIPAFAENMMYHPMEQAQRAFTEMKEMGAQSITGNFQFFDSFQKLLHRAGLHNEVRQTKGADQFILNTIECHDNQLTGKNLGPAAVQGKGTGPASKAMDGLTNLRIRFLLNSAGLPYITTQALTGIGSEKLKDHQIQDTLVRPINLTFDKHSPKYTVGNSEYSFNDFRHNYSNFINKPEIKAILKGGQLSNISPSDQVVAFTVRNKGDESLLIIANSSNQTESKVHLVPPSGFNNNSAEVTEYFIDSSKEPEKTTLPVLHDKTVEFNELKAGEIRIFKFSE